MEDEHISAVMEIVKDTIEEFEGTAVGKIAETNHSPFKVLISTLISSRTKDEVTHKASSRLFNLADNPGDMLDLIREQIQEAIYPAGFYKNKSGYILDTCQMLVDKYDSEVPQDIDKLVELKGVGRKTANLVVTLAFEKPGICVDTHVHRITNRWGYIDTDDPEESEWALRDKLPDRYWISINPLLVTYGQNICTPISPYCSKCDLVEYCDQKKLDTTR